MFQFHILLFLFNVFPETCLSWYTLTLFPFYSVPETAHEKEAPREFTGKGSAEAFADLSKPLGVSAMDPDPKGFHQ